MKRAFRTEVVLSLSTGVLLCEFSAMHEFAEFLSGSPVFTHQFAHKPLWDEWKRGIFAQRPELEPIDASAVNKDNWTIFRDTQLATLGPTLDIAPLAEIATLASSLTEPLQGKPTLFIKLS